MKEKLLILGDEEYTISINFDLDNIVMERQSANERITLPLSCYHAFTETINKLKIANIDELVTKSMNRRFSDKKG